MRILKHNWQWKLISLVIGIMLWSYIIAGVNPTQSITISDIPITVRNQDALALKSYQITSMGYSTVSVQVTGKRNDLGSLNRTNIVAAIDAAQLVEGSQSVQISYNAPSNVVISQTSGSQMEVVVETIVTRSKAIRVEQEGQLGDEFILRGLAATPQTIDVTGPRTLVDSVQDIKVTMNINGLTADTSANLQVTPVTADNEPVTGVRLSLASVNVTASVSKQKAVPVRLTFDGESPAGLRIGQSTIAPNSILIMGKAEEVDALESIDTQPLDRATIFKDGMYPATLRFPDGIVSVNNDREVTAQITVENREERTLTVTAAAVRTQNGESLVANPVNPAETISMTLSGFPQELDSLTPTAIQLHVDLSGLAAGNHTLKLTATAPNGIEVKSIDPAQIEMVVGPAE